MTIERTMSFSDWVNEYKPIQFNEVDGLDVDIFVHKKLIKKAKDLIEKYLTRFPGNVYPVDHISMVYISSHFFLYVVTRKPMVNINKIIIELDARHKITILKSLKDL